VPVTSGPVVTGVDLGVKTLATRSDGTPPIPKPTPRTRRLKTLKRVQRAGRRPHKGSKRQHHHPAAPAPCSR
jgi:transposase